MISHFDKDHVNGIRDLISDMPVARIIMPYMPLLQRLALVASQVDDDDNYNSFVANPTAYFLESDNFNVGSISYVDQSPNDKEIKVPPLNNNQKFEHILDEDIEYSELLLEEPKDNNEAREKIIRDDDELERKNVNYLSSDVILKLSNEIWEFVFYHREARDQTNIADFQKAVRTYMDTQKITNVKDLFDEIRRGEMKKLYAKHITRNINFSSLCMYHGPLFSSRINGRVIMVPSNKSKLLLFPWRWRNRRWRFNRSGTVLTGDQFLKNDNDFNQFYNHFRTRLNRTEIYQVPHHGSKNNWKMMPNELNDHDIRCYVINHGYKRVKHPNKLVFQNLMTHANRQVILNNEHVILEYTIYPN